MFRPTLTATLVATGLLATPALAASTFSQGFETDTAGWFTEDNGWAGTITRQSGGVGAYEGSYYGHYTQTSTAAAGGTTGAFTQFDGYRSTFPGTYSASAAVYLDTSWAAGEGFDYSVASSTSGGSHMRDYIFHVTKDTSTGDLLVGGSNNTNYDPREDLESGNHHVVSASGWYILEHLFYNDGGALSVDLNLRDSGGSLLFTETRSNAGDLIPSVAGGNRYGWFTNIDVANGIYVDATELNVPAAIPLPATLPLMLGALGIGGAALRRKRKG